VTTTKSAIGALSRGPDEDDLAAIQSRHHDTLRSHDHREALRAMREKRPPRFEGR